VTAEDELRAFARDLVEELTAGRVLELASSPLSREDLVALASREGPKPGPGSVSPEDWARGQQQWKSRGDSIWAHGGRWKDIHPGSAQAFQQHVEAAHAHLAPATGTPSLAGGYEALASAHKVATEGLLPRAETDEQKGSVREGIQHVTDRMRQINEAAGVKDTHLQRTVSSAPERTARARELLPQDMASPTVPHQLPQMPPAPKGAQAIHPHLGSHLMRSPGASISGHDMAHVPQPLPEKPLSPEAAALEQANKRLTGYASREERRGQQDLADHLGKIRAAQAQARGQAAPGGYQPLSDDELAAHASQAQDGVEKALRAGRATWQAFTLGHAGQVWSLDRTILHDEILRDFMERQVDVPSSGEAVFLGGMPGAAKPEAPDHAVVSPEAFTRELAQRGKVPEVAGMSPLEASPLVHAEALYLAGQAARMLVERRKNLAWDVTMNDRANAEAWLHWLKAQDYHVSGTFTDTPVGDSASDSATRYRSAMEGYRQGKNELGAHHVPRSAVLAMERAPGVSRGRHTFDQLQQHMDTESRPGSIPSAEALRRQVRGGTSGSGSGSTPEGAPGGPGSQPA
jgi:hypothetical protein